jgi:hypothetical protein
MAWLPVGSTGVIRGAQRNATIYATCDLTLLIIPISQPSFLRGCKEHRDDHE